MGLQISWLYFLKNTFFTLFLDTDNEMRLTDAYNLLMPPVMNTSINDECIYQ